MDDGMSWGSVALEENVDQCFQMQTRKLVPTMHAYSTTVLRIARYSFLFSKYLSNCVRSVPCFEITSL